MYSDLDALHFESHQGLDQQGQPTISPLIQERGTMPSKAVSAEIISNKIFIIRRQKVMLDCDLAQLYGVEGGDVARKPCPYVHILGQKKETPIGGQLRI